MKCEPFGCETGRLYYLSVPQIWCLGQVMLNVACSKSGVNDLLMTAKGQRCCERNTRSYGTSEAYFPFRFLVVQVH